MVDAWLDQIAGAIGGNVWLAPVLAFVAGILTSFTPCSLSSVPLIVGYMGGLGEKSTKRAFVYSVVFSLGTAVAFITLGIMATSAGKLLGNSSPLWYLALGVLMMLMAMQVWGIFDFIPSVNLLSRSRKRGICGAFLAGVLGGIFSSPCSTPVLVALLAVVAGNGDLPWGILLMLLYSIGHSALVVIAGTSVGFVQRLNATEGYSKIGAALRLIMGAVILAVGFYMFWVAF